MTDFHCVSDFPPVNFADIQGCAEGTCFEGVQCRDVRAPGTGFKCGPCPPGYQGDGATCTRRSKGHAQHVGGGVRRS